MPSFLSKSAARRSAFLLTIIFFCATFFSPALCAEENSVPAPTAAENVTTPNAAETQLTTPAATPQQPEDDRLTFMADERAAPQGEAPSTFGLLAKSFGALLLIVGMIFAAGWGLKRYGGARFGAIAEDAPILSVLSTVPLGDRRSLAVIRFGARTLLVGSTQQSVTLLAEETGAEESAADYQTARSVAEMLKQSDAESFAGELDAAERRHLKPAPLDWEPDEEGGKAC